MLSVRFCYLLTFYSLVGILTWARLTQAGVVCKKHSWLDNKIQSLNILSTDDQISIVNLMTTSIFKVLIVNWLEDQALKIIKSYIISSIASLTFFRILRFPNFKIQVVLLWCSPVSLSYLKFQLDQLVSAGHRSQHKWSNCYFPQTKWEHEKMWQWQGKVFFQI